MGRDGRDSGPVSRFHRASRWRCQGFVRFVADRCLLEALVRVEAG